MDKKPSLKINIVMSILYKVLTLFVPLLTTPYLSRVLGAEGIGIYSYEYSIAYYFMIFIMLGLENYGNRAIAEVSNDKYRRSKKFWEIYSVQLFNSITAIFLYFIYVLIFAQNKIMGWIMLGFVVSAAIDITWYFYGIEEIATTVLRNFLIKIGSLVLIFTLVKKPQDLYKYALIMSIGTLVSQLYLWIMLKKTVSFVHIEIKEAIKHIKPLLVLFVPVVAISLYRVMDKIMLGNFAQKFEVGYYESAERIIQLPVQVINAIGMVMMPRIANMISVGNEWKTRKYLAISIESIMLICSFMSFGIMAVSNVFVPAFFGNGFEKCIPLFFVLLPSTWFLAFSNVIRTQFLIPRKRDRLYICSIFGGAGINIVMNFILIPRFASAGAAIGTLLAEMTVCGIQIIGVRNELPIGRYLLKSLYCILIGFVMFLLLKYIPIKTNNDINYLLIMILFGVFFALPFLLLELKHIKKEIS